MSALPEHAVSAGVRIRVDSAGGPSLAWESRRRQVGYSIAARSRRDIEAAVYLLDRDGLAWEDALPAEPGGETTAQATEATHLVDTSKWPPGTRLIIRRERKHPGARRTLFRSDNYRCQGHWTDQAFTPPEADLDIRRHARCENHIARIKDSGAQRFPFQPFRGNQAWLLAVVLADTLVLWFQTICLRGTTLWRAKPKTMRWGYWHTPARITRHAKRLLLRIPRCWPAAQLSTTSMGSTSNQLPLPAGPNPSPALAEHAPNPPTSPTPAANPAEPALTTAKQPPVLPEITPTIPQPAQPPPIHPLKPALHPPTSTP